MKFILPAIVFTALTATSSSVLAAEEESHLRAGSIRKMKKDGAAVAPPTANHKFSNDKPRRMESKRALYMKKGASQTTKTVRQGPAVQHHQAAAVRQVPQQASHNGDEKIEIQSHNVQWSGCMCECNDGINTNFITFCGNGDIQHCDNACDGTVVYYADYPQNPIQVSPASHQTTKTVHQGPAGPAVKHHQAAAFHQVPQKASYKPASAVGCTLYEFEVDCKNNAISAHDSLTDEEVYVRILANGDSYAIAKEEVFHGFCKSGYSELISVCTNEAVDGIDLEVSGENHDALFIDMVRLFKDGNKVNQWGVDEGYGYCLSSDPDDLAMIDQNIGCSDHVYFEYDGYVHY